MLVVDDDAAARALHKEYLSRIQGFHVVAAVGTGENAVIAADRLAIDLILLDIHLPGFSGIEVLHQIRAAHGLDVDIFIVSSSRDRRTVRQSLSARVSGYLLKPFSEETFRARMTEYSDWRATARVAQDEADVPLGQGEIDQLLAVLSKPRRRQTDETQLEDAPLPKGVSPATLQKVRHSLSSWQAMTASDVGGLTGASRATVRRYLDYLVRVGEVDTSHRFGRKGRPEVLYRLAPVNGNS
ncbi:response regulator [Leucobacter sp. HY1910]